MTTRTRGFEILPGFKGAVWPRRQTTLAAGYDLHSAINTTVNPGQRLLIATGVTAYMLPDEELQIRPRSGLAWNKGITVLNAPGTVDSDFYGKHIQVILYNTTHDIFSVRIGDRIAQAIFSKYLIVDEDYPVNVERQGGFGHTGGAQ